MSDKATGSFPAKLHANHGREFDVLQALHKAEHLAQLYDEGPLWLQIAAIHDALKPIIKPQQRDTTSKLPKRERLLEL